MHTLIPPPQPTTTITIITTTTPTTASATAKSPSPPYRCYRSVVASSASSTLFSVIRSGRPLRLIIPTLPLEEEAVASFDAPSSNSTALRLQQLSKRPRSCCRSFNLMMKLMMKQSAPPQNESYEEEKEKEEKNEDEVCDDKVLFLSPFHFKTTTTKVAISFCRPFS